MHFMEFESSTALVDIPHMDPTSKSRDIYRDYVNEVVRYPYLTKEEEFALARTYIDNRDLDAARKLIMSHLRYVVVIANQYRGYGLPIEDLVQEGNIGLMKAVKGFDPSKGWRLSTYSLMWIKSEIMNFIVDNWRIVKVATTKAQRKLFFHTHLLKRTFHSISDEEIEAIANELNVTEKEVRDAEKRFSDTVFMSFDAALHTGEDGEEMNLYSLVGGDINTVQDIREIEREVRNHRKLYTAIKYLDERAQRIVTARWLTDDEHATLAILSEEFNVSKERIRQIEEESFRKMKKFLGEYE